MCFIRNMSILSRSCSPHLEHLSIICRPFYLPREFSSIIVTAVYIPPQADTSMALSKLHDVFSGYINKHPDAAFIIAGDFNKTSLRQVMPNCHQHVRAVVLESGLEMFFYRLGLVLDSLVFGLGLGHRTRQMFKLVSTESSNICFFSLFQNKDSLVPQMGNVIAIGLTPSRTGIVIGPLLNA